MLDHCVLAEHAVIMNESDLITGVGRLGVGNFSVFMNRSWFLNNFRSIALRVTEVGGNVVTKLGW